MSGSSVKLFSEVPPERVDGSGAVGRVPGQWVHPIGGQPFGFFRTLGGLSQRLILLHHMTIEAGRVTH